MQLATAHGRATVDLRERLLQEGHQFTFFQAMRLARRFLDETESLAVRPELSLRFPATDVVRVEKNPEDERLTLTASFFGLYGVSSPLPAFYTQELLQDESNATQEFLDLFHQRLYGLLYVCWEKYRLFLQALESRQAAPLELLHALGGLPLSSDEESGEPLSSGLIRYAGLLGAHPRSASGLATLLSDALSDVSVDIIPFVPRAVEIAREQRLCLGRAANRLGLDSFVGELLNDCQSKFRVRLGPLQRARFHALAPGGQEHAGLVALVEAYLSDPLDYDFELILDGADLRPACLGGREWSSLGSDTALFTGAFPGDLHVVFAPSKNE